MGGSYESRAGIHGPSIHRPVKCHAPEYLGLDARGTEGTQKAGGRVTLPPVFVFGAGIEYRLRM